MVNENMQERELIARKEIPDAWGARGICPACGAKPLKVVHSPDLPDYFLCPKCELSFEAEINLKAIRVKNVPEMLGFVEEKLRYRWVKPATLAHYLNNRQALIQEKIKPAVQARALSDEEVWNRMVSLYRLGNKPKMIQFMLIQAGATPAQADAGFARLKRLAEQDTERQSRKLLLAGGITLFIIFAFIAGAAFTYNDINSQLGEKAAHRSTANQPLTPLQVLDKLPNAVKPGFLKSAPVRVETKGPGKAPCPNSAQEAAKLFGGQANLWQMGSQPGMWQMINPGNPATIRIPEEMYAGYIDNKTYVTSSVNGPATIYNVNFIAIICD